MNDIDAMRRLAAANPVPSPLPPGSSQAQFCLRTVLAQPVPRKSRRRAHRLIPAAAALVLIAAGGAFVTITRRAPTPPPRATVVAPPAVLAGAADRAGQPSGKGQFLHVRGTSARVMHIDDAGGYNLIRVDDVRGMQPADGRPGEGWLIIGDEGSSVRPVTDRDAASWRRDGSPGPGKQPDTVSPNLADDPEFDGDVASLPDAAEVPVADREGWLFRECTRLLDVFTNTLSGADRATLFRTLAGLHGIRTLDAATDPAGRPATGLAYTGETPRYGLVDWQIYLLAGTDQIGFSQAVVRRPGPANATLAPGTVQYSLAVLDTRRSQTP
ncbi:hypothetical protein [Actinoplanes sp. NPDC089786]|uniref:hypothetical protein n=1 Tax=Actinoplanes sp. NPDC089786 TaxID=3155185 RepID=UPI0034451DF3